MVDATSLNLTIRRIQAIEQKFQELSGVNEKTDGAGSDFQSILNSTMKYGDGSMSTDEIDGLIGEYSDKNGLDTDFVRALIKQESGFKPTATSSAGAMGLMQLMPGTAQGLGVTDAYNPESNIAGGTKYLKNLLNKYSGNKELALAAYNAGPGAVQKYGGIPPYKETQNYVKSVLSQYQNYKSRGTQ